MPPKEMPDLAERLRAPARSCSPRMVNTLIERPVCIEIDQTEPAVSELGSHNIVRADGAPHRLRFPMPSDDADDVGFRAYPFFTMSR